MQKEIATLDFTYAKTPLFVRQSLAKTFGVPLNQEFTWPILRAKIFDPAHSIPVKSLLIVGQSNLAQTLPEESNLLSSFLKELGMLRPDIDIRVALHD
jgi:hypothetical protein